MAINQVPLGQDLEAIYFVFTPPGLAGGETSFLWSWGISPRQAKRPYSFYFYPCSPPHRKGLKVIDCNCRLKDVTQQMTTTQTEQDGNRQAETVTRTIMGEDYEMVRCNECGILYPVDEPDHNCKEHKKTKDIREKAEARIAGGSR